MQEWKRKLIASEEKFSLMLHHRLVLHRRISVQIEDDIVKDIVGSFRKLNT